MTQRGKMLGSARFCRGVSPWAPLAARPRGAHGGTPLQFPHIVLTSQSWESAAENGDQKREVRGHRSEVRGRSVWQLDGVAKIREFLKHRKANGAMLSGDRPKTLRRRFNPMSHVGTHAQQSSL